MGVTAKEAREILGENLPKDKPGIKNPPEPKNFCTGSELEDRIRKKFPGYELEKRESGADGIEGKGRVTVIEKLDPDQKKEVQQAAGKCSKQVGFRPPSGGGGGNTEPVSPGKTPCNTCNNEPPNGPGPGR